MVPEDGEMKFFNTDKPREVPGLRYEKCDVCGERWNVSRLRSGKWYICPKCYRGKERGGKDNAGKVFREAVSER